MRKMFFFIVGVATAVLTTAALADEAGLSRRNGTVSHFEGSPYWNSDDGPVVTHFEGSPYWQSDAGPTVTHFDGSLYWSEERK